jgi:cytochrome c-type biogenesis protein
MEGIGIGFAVAFAAGMLSFLSPCVLPLVPSYVSFVAGVGLEELEAGGREVKRTALVHSLIFVAGFSVVFIALGASASFLGQLLTDHRVWITRIGGVLVVLFGLHLLGVTPMRFLQRERRIHLQDKPLGWAGTFAVGLTFGAGWSPCIGPILGGILTYAAGREHLVEGVQLLAVYSAGLAIPFLLSAAALSWFLASFAKFRRYIPWVERASGALLVLVGMLLLSGQFTALASWAAKFTPEFIYENI